MDFVLSQKWPIFPTVQMCDVILREVLSDDNKHAGVGVAYLATAEVSYSRLQFNEKYY